MQEYLDRRAEAAARGQNFNEPLTVDLAGPVYGKPGFYSLDKNNFQPRVAVAWSPSYKSGFMGKLFGTEKQSTFRGGFAITNDYFGQALAVNFDGNNTLGFSSNQTPSANTYNVTTNPAPLITALGMPVRNLPGIATPANLTFPQTQPQDFQRRIEGSLDTNLVSPINYSWNFTYGRQFGKGIYVETSYIGRLARNLLATRDVMQLNNIVDPKSGQDWYTAAGILEQARVDGTPVASIPNLPWFENMYPHGELDGLFFGQGLSNIRQLMPSWQASERLIAAPWAVSSSGTTGRSFRTCSTVTPAANVLPEPIWRAFSVRHHCQLRLPWRYGQCSPAPARFDLGLQLHLLEVDRRCFRSSDQRRLWIGLHHQRSAAT